MFCNAQFYAAAPTKQASASAALAGNDRFISSLTSGTSLARGSARSPPPSGKEPLDEQAQHLDFRLAPERRGLLEKHRESHSPAQPHLVDLRRASRVFHLAGLEHRRDQAAAGGLQIHDRRIVSARGAAGPDRLAHAAPLRLPRHHPRAPQIAAASLGGAVGGRKWTIFSLAVLFIPTLALAYFVTQPDTPFWLMLMVAATAGLGGGNFASSMANISFFYPDRIKGWALGVNAAGGNIGVSGVQLLTPILLGVGLVNLYQLTAGPSSGERG